MASTTKTRFLHCLFLWVIFALILATCLTSHIQIWGEWSLTFKIYNLLSGILQFSYGFCHYPLMLWNLCRSCFGKLGEIINACEKLKEQSRFLFIPGPDDAGKCPHTFYPYERLFSCGSSWHSCNVSHILYSHDFILAALIIIWYLLSAGPSSALPKCALPEYLTEEIQKHVPLAVFSSNPCRLGSQFLNYSVQCRNRELIFCLMS